MIRKAIVDPNVPTYMDLRHREWPSPKRSLGLETGQ